MQHPGLRQKIALGILGVEPRLDRMAGRRQILLAPRQRLAGGDPQLPLDEIEPGHRLGHRMLDLEPRVHLDEIELAALGDELDGAGADIADRAGGGDRRLGHRPAPFGVEPGRRRFLDHLLMAALDRAVALEEMDRHCRAGRRRSAPRYAAAGAGISRSACGRRQRRPAPRAGPPSSAAANSPASATIRMPRPPPPADALISTGKPIRRASSASRAGVLLGAVIARHQRHPGPRHQRLGRRLRAHRPHRRGRRPDEDEPGLARRPRRNRRSPTGTRSPDAPPAPRSPAPRRGSRRCRDSSRAPRAGPIGQRLVGLGDMQRVAVGLGIDRDRGDPQPARGADHPAGDLAAIGDQDLAKTCSHPEDAEMRGLARDTRNRRVEGWPKSPRPAPCAYRPGR